MEPRKILALTAVSLVVAGGVCAEDSEGDANPPPQRPGFGGPEAQGPVTEEQRQAAQGPGAESRRPGGFTEEKRQAMRERRGSMSNEERAAAREGAEQRRGGQARGGGQSGRQFPGGQSGRQTSDDGSGQGSRSRSRSRKQGPSDAKIIHDRRAIPVI